MDARRITLLILAGLAFLAAAATCAQERRDAPWPSEVFNPQPKQNAAGKFDYYTMVMSWSPTHCVTAQEGRDEQQCARQDGLRYGFVLHGLWPQHEKGYPEACPIGRKPFVPQPVINSMLDIMPSGGLVIHEFKLHGTCSGLEPADYYKLSRQLFTRVRIPERFQNPFETQFVAPRELVDEFMRANPWLRPEMIAVNCGGPGNRLRDIRICLTREGAPRACGQNENQRKLCRAEQMHVPPVRSTRYDGNRMKREGASTNPLQPQRDRGLPRPRVLESPGRF
jgi:ribonuclease T2